MRLENLRVRDFRNYAAACMQPGPGLNLLVGANGQGKTNLLEAIWMLGGARSPRTADLRRLVRSGAPAAQVEGAVLLDSTGARREVCLTLAAGGGARAYTVNGRRVPRALDWLGQVLVVWFSPDEVDVVRGSPATRRRFLDVALAQVDPVFREAAARYARALQQRNRALQRLAGAPHSGQPVVEAWDAPLARAGAVLSVRRQQMLAELTPVVCDIHARLAGAGPGLQLAYRPAVPEEAAASVSAYEAALLSRLQHLAQLERARRLTLAGPHREDFEVRLEDLDLRAAGSRGQQRTAAVALFVALWNWVSDRAGEPAILLLDDAGSELDISRRRRLVEVLPPGAQVFATATEVGVIPKAVGGQARLWRVSGGQLELVPVG